MRFFDDASTEGCDAKGRHRRRPKHELGRAFTQNRRRITALAMAATELERGRPYPQIHEEQRDRWGSADPWAVQLPHGFTE